MTFILFPLLKKNNSVEVKQKVAVYRAIIRPILTYACPALSNCPETYFRKLQIQQNKCLRMALNKDFYTKINDLHAEAKIPKIRELVDKLTKDFYLSNMNHDNPLIKNLGTYNHSTVDFPVKHRLSKKII